MRSPSIPRYSFRLWAFALGLPAILSSQSEKPATRATIKPSVIHLAPGGEQKFKVIMAATRLHSATAPKKVLWSVNDISGGSAQAGTIDEMGVYRAPSKAPVPSEIRIGAQVEEAENSHLWATVIMGNAEPSYKMIGSWEEPTENPGRLRKPHGISVNQAGDLLIADQGANRVFRYGKDGKLLGEIGRGSGSEGGQFTEPRFAAVDDSGNIFVTDIKSDRPRIQVFDPKGKLIRQFAEKGTGPGYILRGHGLAFDSKQRLFVTDVDNMRVSAYERTGKFLFSWGKDGLNAGEFNAPHGLVIDANDDVFVNGYYGPTQKFTADGRFLTAFAFGDAPDGAVYFHSINGDRWGNVYVTVRTKEGYGGALESQAGKKVSIMKFNNNGDYICSLSLSVKEHTESWAAVDHSGVVYALFTAKGKAGVEIFAQQ